MTYEEDFICEHTKKAVIVAGLRQIWLRSKERANRLKYDSYTCQNCHKKASKAKGNEFKVQVHHKHGVLNWDAIIEALNENLLCDIDKLETLCKECHKEKDKALRTIRDIH